MARTLITNRDLANDTASLNKVSGGALLINGSVIGVVNDLLLNNDIKIRGKDTTGGSHALAWISTSNENMLGNVDFHTVLQSQNNPEVNVAGVRSLLWHAGNDGAGSGLDSDLLDGQHGSYYLDWVNITNKPDPVITLSGDVSGSGTMTDLGSVNISVTVLDDSHIHDGRYYTESEADSRFVNNTGDTINGLLEIIQATSGQYALRLFNTNDIGGNCLLIESYGGNNDDILIKVRKDTNGTPADAFSLDGKGNLRFLGTLQQGTIPWARLSGQPTVTVNNGLTGGGQLTDNITISHDDTSDQASVDNSNGVVIQDITLDTYGHVTAIGSYDLDDRYYTETESNTLFVNASGDTMSGMLTADAGITVNGDSGIVITEGSGGANGWAIKRSGDNLQFIQPEDGDKLQFEIQDDTGVSAPFGYKVGVTQVIDSSGKIVAPNIKTTTLTFTTSDISKSWQHDYGSTSYVVSALPDSSQRHIFISDKKNDTLEISLDDYPTATITVDVLLVGS